MGQEPGVTAMSICSQGFEACAPRSRVRCSTSGRGLLTLALRQPAFRKEKSQEAHHSSESLIRNSYNIYKALKPFNFFGSGSRKPRSSKSLTVPTLMTAPELPPITLLRWS